MKKALEYIRNHHGQLYNIIVVVLSTLAIVYVLPKEVKFKYDIKNLKGKPWHYESITAPFDFAIKKSDEQISKEKKEIYSNLRVYFKYDPKHLEKAKLSLKEAFEEEVDTSEASLSAGEKFMSVVRSVSGVERKRKRSLEVGLAILDTVFLKGVVRLDDDVRKMVGTNAVKLTKGKVEYDKSLSSFFTLREAHNYIEKKINKARGVDEDELLARLEELLAYNVTYDEARTKQEEERMLNGLSTTYGKILNGQIIINKGEIVDDAKYQLLQSLKQEYERQTRGAKSYWITIAGQALITVLCLLILVFFLLQFRKDVFLDNTKFTFVFFLVTVVILSTSFLLGFKVVGIYAFPFCMLPVIIRTFYDTRMALFTHLVTMVLISFFALDRFEFIVLQIITGIIAIFSIVTTRKRSQIFLAAALIFIGYSLSYFGYRVMQEGSFDDLQWVDFVWFATSATLTLFTYPLIFVFEKVFGFLSDVSLFELSDMNSPLLRELSLNAPGTFQHSLQVANLAEEVTYHIGGNTLLIRTGALYHDVGKLDAPTYFIENQRNGINPHDELGDEESASIIIDHVIKGVELARKYKLPEQIIDFIRTHHGTTKTWYFYTNFKNLNPDQEIDDKAFEYPGPIPFSKETAVLMMADSVEAASRSLKSYDEQTIGSLVDGIIDRQVEAGQFQNADITFKDITVARKILKKMLMNIYHVRVEYPR